MPIGRVRRYLFPFLIDLEDCKMIVESVSILSVSSENVQAVALHDAKSLKAFQCVITFEEGFRNAVSCSGTML